jgi:hypothetical protein
MQAGGIAPQRLGATFGLHKDIEADIFAVQAFLKYDLQSTCGNRTYLGRVLFRLQ